LTQELHAQSENEILVAKVKKEQLQSSPLRTSPRTCSPLASFFSPFRLRRARFVFEKTDLHSLCASGERAIEMHFLTARGRSRFGYTLSLRAHIWPKKIMHAADLAAA
jgi:hypothetical protein